MDHSKITIGTSVRGRPGLGVVRTCNATTAVVEFASGCYPVALASFRTGAESSISGGLVKQALDIHKALTLRLEKGETLSAQEAEALRCAAVALEIGQAQTLIRPEQGELCL